MGSSLVKVELRRVLVVLLRLDVLLNIDVLQIDQGAAVLWQAAVWHWLLLMFPVIRFTVMG